MQVAPFTVELTSTRMCGVRYAYLPGSVTPLAPSVIEASK